MIKPPTLDFPVASPVRRLLASLIDSLVVFAPLTIADIFFTEHFDIVDDSSLVNPWGTAPALWALIGFETIVGVLYFTICHARWGWTLGKLALGIRVISLSSGRPPTYGKAALRGLIYSGAPLLPLIGPLANLVDMVRLCFDKRRQCLHDMFVGTIVIESRRRKAQALVDVAPSAQVNP
ncbi:Uncharacterized membrane protein YckC, RDD family [Streptosporangium subroseum]|uniref:Uncharacterized membrane protein YckC, RDD family n=1 Tax=Streptosporangium subroseum TaxID=106412 RepID=A0A239P4P5_9ACTN|nr:RDD family protein [Streptosporangium subroseum]SNT62046.1 Uncharacterized membrane protein YckC, RDD family [Streptosporangium subroseum]